MQIDAEPCTPGAGAKRLQTGTQPGASTRHSKKPQVVKVAARDFQMLGELRLGEPASGSGSGLFDVHAHAHGVKRPVSRRGKKKSHIRFETYKSQDRVAIDAPRRQSVSLDA